MRRKHISRLLGFLSLVVVLLIPGLAGAQTGAGPAPRTLWGTPNLEGVWDFRTITPMERPEELGNQEFLTAGEAANLEQEATARNERLSNEGARLTEAGGNVGAYNNFWMDRGTRTVGTRRTSLIIDPPNGRIPPRTPAGERRAETKRARQQTSPADSWVDRSIYERCVLGFNSGPPMEPRAYNNHMQLFQTPDHVVIFNEMVHDARIIPVDANGSFPNGIRQWMGHSRGRWEGDTFVVETTHLYGVNSFTERNVATQDMTVTERFTRTDAETLTYQFTVEDSATWTRPWSAEVPMARSDDQVWEYACHEGNYGMDGILAGHRAEEQEAAR